MMFICEHKFHAFDKAFSPMCSSTLKLKETAETSRRRQKIDVTYSRSSELLWRLGEKNSFAMYTMRFQACTWKRGNFFLILNKAAAAAEANNFMSLDKMNFTFFFSSCYGKAAAEWNDWHESDLQIFKGKTFSGFVLERWEGRNVKSALARKFPWCSRRKWRKTFPHVGNYSTEKYDNDTFFCAAAAANYFPGRHLKLSPAYF